MGLDAAGETYRLAGSDSCSFSSEMARHAERTTHVGSCLAALSDAGSIPAASTKTSLKIFHSILAETGHEKKTKLLIIAN